MSTRWRRLALVLVLALAPLCATALPPGLREIAIYPALGVFPGLLLAGLLARWPGRLEGWIVALALSPLLSAVAGMVLMDAGVGLEAASTGIALASGVGCLLLALFPEAPHADGPIPPGRGWLPWAFGFAGLMALLPVLNRWVLVHNDSWFHAGMIWQIVRNGIPPDSPCFAGFRSNYMWIYDLFIAMQVGPGRDPFVLMAVSNVVNSLVYVALIHRMALTLWRDERAAAGAAALSLFGLNAGVWVLWPLNLIRAFKGEVRGWAEVHRQLSHVHFLNEQVLDFLTAPFAQMTNLIDKFSEGTALNYAWILLLLYLWSAFAWLERGRRRDLVPAVIATAGLFFIHAVVAMSATPVMIGTLALLIVARAPWPWLPSRGRLAALLAATVAGAVLGVPYLRAVSSGWAPEHSGEQMHLIHVGWVMPWTLGTSLAVAALLAWKPMLRSFQERQAVPAVAATFTVAMTVFSMMISLPQFNESKFVFQILFMLALFGGTAFFPAVAGLVERRGRAGAAVVLALVFAVGPVLTVVGWLADPHVRTDPKTNVTPAEARLHAWIATHTPVRAVFVDAGYRDLLMSYGQRRLYFSASYEPFKMGFPARELERRGAVMADLFGACARPDSDAVALRSLREPVYVLYRSQDSAGTAQPWQTLANRQDLFERVYDAEGFRVFRALPAATRPN